MTRCLCPVADEVQVWGVDQSAKHVLWCQQNLSPPCKFVTCTTFPHLPFEDNYFDFIFAGSVFTHIGDLEDAWLMELRRITRPQGKLYITVADERTVEIFMSSQPGDWLYDTPMRHQLLDFDREHHFVGSGYQLITIGWAPGNGQVLHGRRYIEKQWGAYFDILAVVPEAYDYQTAVIMCKPESRRDRGFSAFRRFAAQRLTLPWHGQPSYTAASPTPARKQANGDEAAHAVDVRHPAGSGQDGPGGP